MSAEGDVQYEVRERVARITIDRAERRNALRAETVEGLLAAFCRAGSDGEVRVIVLTGAGDKAFCAGADLGSPSGEAGARALGFRQYAELLESLSRLDKPIVGRVAGHCVGGGLGLMLGCDLVYAADDVRIGTPEVKVGLFPMMVAALLPRGASRKRVLEMVLTGELVTAGEAERVGLITRAVPRGELDGRVDEVTAAIAARAPLALSLGRQAWNATETMALPAALDYLCGQLEVLMRSEDAAEGLRAFAEKREPRWSGR